MSGHATSTVLDALEALALARPFTPASVTRVLGVPLTFRPELSNPHFAIHIGKGDPSGPYAEVELREARVVSRDGLVVVTLAPSIDVRKPAVFERFGVRPEPSIPTPRQPTNAPLYLVYRFAWGDARFGFDRAGEQPLRVVVLDATEARL